MRKVKSFSALDALGSVLLIATLVISGCTSVSAVREASGIARQGRDLLIVGDESPGSVHRYRLSPADLQGDVGSGSHEIVVDNSELDASIGGPLALDLESVELLPDGDVAVLSERSRALVTGAGMLFEYPAAMAEIGGKGLEGLAISDEKKVAVLWEGGFFEPGKLPTAAGPFLLEPMKPLLCVHDIPAETPEVCSKESDLVALDVPAAPIATQAFRAPDLVWLAEDQIIVLLSSTNVENDSFKFKWLQRFNIDGSRLGQPLNLCAPGYLPAELRSGRDSNFEGLDWFDENERVVLINDYKEAAATAVVLNIKPWPSTDSAVACDQ